MLTTLSTVCTLLIVNNIRYRILVKCINRGDLVLRNITGVISLILFRIIFQSELYNPNKHSTISQSLGLLGQGAPQAIQFSIPIIYIGGDGGVSGAGERVVLGRKVIPSNDGAATETGK